jgi:type II secretory pathway pseudopilin PulG
MASRTAAGKNQGFTYLAMMITVAAIGFGLAAIGELDSHARQREKEVELLFVGDQFRQAIAAYYERTPGMVKRYPQKLEDLLQDSRYPMLRRYLRRIYPDPMTGNAQWGLMPAPGGGIMGVYSLSEAAPVKSGGFSKPDQSLADAAQYQEWKFFYSPPGLVPQR